ncbi:MAG: response regulator transcription factor [Spirochaetales bacterium]|nr:response regulator transcription factor [Spirochaetales bacterium]
MALIAVVDDEKSIRETLSYALEKEGHRVRCFTNGEEAWRSFQKERPELLILDIMMPRMDGLELCRRIRSADQLVPLMFLSSKDEEFDRILGLEIGADDYLCKPFSLRELCTRVKVLLRRSGSSDEYGNSRRGAETGTSGLQLNEESFRAWWKGEALSLSISEFRILKDLSSAPDSVRSREQLIQAAFPHDHYVSDRSIDSHIKRLRKKLAAADEDFNRIEAVYGVGYRFRTES